MFPPNSMLSYTRCIGALVIYSLLVPFLYADERVPFIEELAAEEYNVREEGSLKLKKWALENKTITLDLMLQTYLVSADPEVKGRVYVVIEEVFQMKKAAYFGITYKIHSARLPDGKEVTALRVQSLKSSGSASLAGVEKNDLIIGFNGQYLPANSKKEEVASILSALNVGEKTLINIIRNEKQLSLRVTLRGRPSDDEGADLARKQKEFQDWFTLKVKELTLKN